MKALTRLCVGKKEGFSFEHISKESVRKELGFTHQKYHDTMIPPL